jgi:diguanylate cyclase (GGDEF)-like protein/PAS domain S-box-containing protein
MDTVTGIDTDVLHNIIAHNADGIMITDASETIIYVNEAFASIMGYGVDEIVGGTPSMFQSGKRDVVFYTQMWEELLTNGWWKGELWDKRKDGRIVPTQTTITIIYAPGTGAIKNCVAITRDVTNIKHYEQELKQLAFNDHLTGLYNRRLFDQFVAEHFSLSKRNNTKYAIILIDLDNFGLINNNHGHGAGDAVLKHIATGIRNVFKRDQDIVARLGGDEFVVLVTNMDESVSPAEFCSHTCQEFVSTIRQPIMYNGAAIQVTASVGVAFSDADLLGADELLSRADQAMYESKKRGKNSYTIYGDAVC